MITLNVNGQLQTNLCRCGTHMRIVRAVQRAAGLMQAADVIPPGRAP